MANNYSQVHLQFIFAPRFRQALIHPSWKEELHRYITALVQEGTHKMLAVNSVPDHLHMLVGFRGTESYAKLMERVKSNASRWINAAGKTQQKFEWQTGYGVFSYDRARFPDIVRYIHNQEEHHRKVTFLEEYRQLLDLFEVEYEDRYLFHEPE